MGAGEKYMDYIRNKDLMTGEKKFAEISMKNNAFQVTESARYKWKNKGGTCDRECTCGTWKAHWEKLVEEEFGEKKLFGEQPCSNEGCSNKAKGKKAEHGAHIFHSGNNEKKEWIAPLCSDCNHSSKIDPFDLRVGTILVRANKGETCEISK